MRILISALATTMLIAVATPALAERVTGSVTWGAVSG